MSIPPQQLMKLATAVLQLELRISRIESIMGISRNHDTPAEAKQRIIEIFTTNVKNKPIEIQTSNSHCGGEGHWLEKQMGLTPNSSNTPDIYGYEMKKMSPKITFGDFSASEYAFSQHRPNITAHNEWDNFTMSRVEFIKYFGEPNASKHNRFSWSGKPVPSYYNTTSVCGQTLRIHGDDIVITYNFAYDTRERAKDFPAELKRKECIIAFWSADKMRAHINNKFNSNGFFVCVKNNNVYDKIIFGRPFNFDEFIQGIKDKKIIFDSGMYQTNSRNYSQFRATDFWTTLLER